MTSIHVREFPEQAKDEYVAYRTARTLRPYLRQGRSPWGSFPTLYVMRRERRGTERRAQRQRSLDVRKPAMQRASG